MLDSLYSIPKVTVSEAKIRHITEKDSGKSRGVLQLKLEVERDTLNSKDNDAHEFASLVIVLGTFERRMLLVQINASLGRSKTVLSIEKELNFDWDAANADGGEGGGYVILRILRDSIRGMDLEMQIKLR